MALRGVAAPTYCQHRARTPSPPPPPHAREERNAWKHHYCVLLWTTVNGRVKVPLKMHDDERKQTNKKMHTRNEPMA